MAPSVAASVVESYLDWAADPGTAIDGNPLHGIILLSMESTEHLAARKIDDLEAAFGAGTSANQERKPWVRELEGVANQFAHGDIGADLRGTDPIFSEVHAFGIFVPSGDSVALDRLVEEGSTGGGPVDSIPTLKIKVHGFLVAPCGAESTERVADREG